MKALNFVIGMIVGMVLLVVAVVGAVFAAGSLVSVGQIENTLGTDIFDDESDVNNKTILELVQSLIGDLQNMDELTIEKLRTDYGLKIPTEISGIDITPLFGYSLLEVPDHLGDVVNNMTLRDVGEFLDMDFETEYPDLRVLQDNLDEKVNVALDNVLSSIDDEKMTVYTIERDFGLSLGENNLLVTLRHTPLSSFAEVMDNLPVGVVIDADSDLFVENGKVSLYVVTDDYIEVPANELTSALADGKNVTETYIAGADENGLVYREMRYVMNDDGTYEPDNSCYASSFDAEANTETYYRHIVYTAYDSAATYGADAVFAVKTFLNDFVSDGAGGFVLADGGFLTLDNILASEDGNYSLNEAVLDGTAKVTDGSIDFADIPVFASVTADDDTVSVLPAAEYGLDPKAVLDDNTRLDDNFTGYLRIHVGTAEPPAQVIAGETISTIAGATDALTSLKLGEVLDIDENSAKILKTLADTPINKMSEALDTIVLADATDIVMSEYTMADNGSYVFVANDGPVGGEAVMDGEKYLGYFTLYNPAVHTGENIKRYDRTVSDGDASVALQRLAGTTIPNISKAFSGMVLGDALNVDVDTFAPVSDPQPGETYYVFKEKLGYPERVVYNENAAGGVTYYERTHEGEGNAVLKQLAYVKIDNISEAMDGIIENTLLSDIIEVTEYTVAQYVPDGTPETDEDQWLFEADPNYTENAGDKTSYYTFVYDGSGKYYMTDVVYLPATANQLTVLTEKTFGYKQYSDDTSKSAAAFVAEHGTNIYFPAGDGAYKTNPALVAYYVAKGNLSALQAAYYRTEDADASDIVTVSVYKNVEDLTDGSGLYVISNGAAFGSYEPYNPDDPTHWGEAIYFKYTDGYYPASDGNGTHSFDFTTGSFSERAGGEYIRLEAKYEDGRTEADGSTSLALYYYSLIDSEYKEGYTVYSKRECDYIFLENKANGGWTNVSGEWEEYNEAIHGTDAARYDRVIGYIGGNAANDGGTGLPSLSDTKVTVREEKSPTILISLLERQVTIGSLNETIDTLTIGEMMEIEPGSVFDNPALSGSTVDGLSANVNSMFTDMTIGTLLKYANIAVSPQVSYILQDVKLADFFGALEYQYQNGQLTVNMEKLFGIA